MYMGLNGRKPVLGKWGGGGGGGGGVGGGGSLLFALWKVSHVNLLQVKFQFSSQSV